MSKEDLEKEAKVYANAIERKASKEIVKIAYMDSAEPREKRIEQLEKENENLKARLYAINLLTPELEKLSKDKDNKLAQAKEHIKILLDCLKQDTNDPQTNYYVCQYMDKAEQFLKEIEK